MRVAQAAAAATRDHRFLADRDEIRDEGIGRVVEHGRARWDLEDQVVAGLAVPAGAGPATARSRLEVVAVLEVAQRRLARVDAEDDGAAATAVTAVRAAARDVGLAPEGRRAVATRAGMHPDLDAVEEHRGHPRTVRPAEASRGRGRA